MRNHLLTTVRRSSADGATVMYRDQVALRRNPALIAANLAGPLGLVLVFGYVFGGALAAASPGTAYREALIPAVFVLVAGTGLVIAAGSAAMDVQSGVTERFRSLPMGRFAVPLGATGSQLILSMLSLAVMAPIGLVVGWRVRTGPDSVIAGFALLLLFGYALTWMGVYLGLAVRNEEVVQQLAPLILGLVLISNAFVPTATMPTVVRVFAEWNPFSAAITAIRDLFGNGVALHGPLPLEHPVWATIMWSVAIIALFAPLAAKTYAQAD
jgi:ABC-2 type transport system permease protein